LNISESVNLIKSKLEGQVRGWSTITKKSKVPDVSVGVMTSYRYFKMAATTL